PPNGMGLQVNLWCGRLDASPQRFARHRTPGVQASATVVGAGANNDLVFTAKNTAKQTAHQAALQTTGLISKLTLLDYLRCGRFGIQHSCPSARLWERPLWGSAVRSAFDDRHHCQPVEDVSTTTLSYCRAAPSEPAN
ncbi:MAG: hypothetical protein ACREJM_12225, partial [Candidatus Saccharimonadales bacterium]